MTRKRKMVVPIHQFKSKVRKCKGCGFIPQEGYESHYKLGLCRCTLFGGLWCDSCHAELHHRHGKLY